MGEGSIAPEEPHRVTVRISRYDRLRNPFSSIRAMYITAALSAAFKVAMLVEAKLRVITHTAEMTVPCRAFLCAVYLTELSISSVIYFGGLRS